MSERPAELPFADAAQVPAVALSIRQPWAWTIVSGLKEIENRDWPTRFRGTVLIHAGKAMTQADYDDCMDLVDELVPLDKPNASRRRALVVNGDAPRGGIVGAAEVADCVSESSSPWFFGRYGFVLRNARTLPFLPCRGALGFFRTRVPKDYAAAARLLDTERG